MTGHRRILVVPTENGKPGPLDGPFRFEIAPDEAMPLQGTDANILETLVAFVRHVARGVSCYNNNEFENSSNLKSYSAECMSDLQSDEPEMAMRLQSLIIDCSRLPVETRAHPIWKLDRAILSALPGVGFIDS
jgi:hypothetical protein